MAFINVVLDAEDEVTPTFTSEDIGGKGHIGEQFRLLAQGSRTTATNNGIDIALDACLVNEDGTLHQMHNGTELVDAWYKVDGAFFSISSSRDTHVRSKIYGYGVAFRFRYNTNSTTPIRVLVETQYRDVK